MKEHNLNISMKDAYEHHFSTPDEKHHVDQKTYNNTVFPLNELSRPSTHTNCRKYSGILSDFLLKLSAFHLFRDRKHQTLTFSLRSSQARWQWM